MSIENRLHAVLLVAFVALASAAFVTTAWDDGARETEVAQAKTTHVASAGAAPRASR
jgi:hypothetical protein